MLLHKDCHLIAVSGGKGGVGKSVFAANLAAAFLKEMGAPTLLIDLDAQSCGDQNIILGLKPKKTVNDLCRFTGVINSQNVRSHMDIHSSGLAYLSALSGSGQKLSAPDKIFAKQLAAISSFFKYIIIDLGTEIGDLQLRAIDECSALILVSTPEVLALNQTKRQLNELSVATVPQGIIRLALNKIDATGLNAQSINSMVRLPVIGQIPKDDVTAHSALQRSTPFVLEKPKVPASTAYHQIVRNLTGGTLQKLKSLSRPKRQDSNRNATSLGETGASTSPTLEKRGVSSSDPQVLLKLQIHSELIKEMDLKKDLTGINGDPEKERELRNKTQQTISKITDRLGSSLSRQERSITIKEVLDEALGLGPLEDLLSDKTVTEVMVNGSEHIYAEKNGKLILTDVQFTSNLQLRNVIERIVTPLGRRIDEKTPYVDARLQDGSRVNAVIEPLAIDGPSVTIRKFPEERITIDDYTKRFNSLTPAMGDFLKICVEQGLNIIISGGTGSGKTTLLNVMSGFVPENERIITVEDAAELQLKQDHVVRLETRPANMEGTGAVSIRDLIRNSLRMRPDRIIVGECRDGAALDMLSAMNTGHDGSMTTVHANSPREAVSRLETLCLMAGMDLPAKAIREQVAGAVNLIVQIGRLSDGSRKVKNITEIVGMQGETITLQEIFKFKEEGFDKNRKIIGRFQSTGSIPTFIEKFEKRGVTIPRNLFVTGGTTPEKDSEAVAPTPIKRPAANASASGQRPSVRRSTPVRKVSGGK